jgi:hypothetical protein
MLSEWAYKIVEECLEPSPIGDLVDLKNWIEDSLTERGFYPDGRPWTDEARELLEEEKKLPAPGSEETAGFKNLMERMGRLEGESNGQRTWIDDLSDRMKRLEDRVHRVDGQSVDQPLG